MTGLSLMARFPLGVYYGHKQDSSIDPSPSPARLHSALVNAAAQGSLGEDGQPSSASLKALRWLENNPPDELHKPDSMFLTGPSPRFIYRNVSAINTKRRTEERAVSDGIAVSGAFGYRWSTAPSDVAETITTLASDIGCLGEAHSIAIIEPHDFEANLKLDRTAHAFTPGASALQVALPGRTDELIASHQAGFGKKVPTVASDKAKSSEKPAPTPVSYRNVTDALYRPINDEHHAASPWTEAYFFELDQEVSDKHRVELATAMHRALVAYVGSDVSSIITGKYVDRDVPRPANRLAIQYLPSDISARFHVDGPALVLFVPQGVDATDLAQIQRAFEIKKLWSRRIGRIGIRFSGIAKHGDRFWDPPAPGMQRFWKPLTPVIPETRRVSKSGEDWTLADSGLLSLAYVWRDEFEVQATGEAKYVSLRDQVAARGAAVHGARTLAVRGANFVHRTHRSVPTQPYEALFELGDLGDDQTAIMVGQSRHLGGGLLVPFDVCVEEIAEHDDGGDQ